MRTTTLLTTALFSTASLAVPAHAEDVQWYIGGSLGLTKQSDSSNSGQTGAFTTGNGAPAVPDGTAIAAGTDYGWDTEFDNGFALSGELGLTYDSRWRSGIELVYSKSDVDTHSGVTLGGTNIDGVDAAVLTGSSTQLGVTVGDVVADGRGDINQTGLFFNGYYTLVQDGTFQPYLGAGIGFLQTDVTYQPSGIPVVSGDETKFAYQIKGGVSAVFDNGYDVYGELTWRASDDVELDNQLFPGTLNVENTAIIASVGVRYRFGGY